MLISPCGIVHNYKEGGEVKSEPRDMLTDIAVISEVGTGKENYICLSYLM
jgi:hypothetical protein